MMLIDGIVSITIVVVWFVGLYWLDVWLPRWEDKFWSSHWMSSYGKR